MATLARIETSGMSDDDELSEFMSLTDRAAQALRRARKLPLGKTRNELRELATLLLHLHRSGLRANVKIIDRHTIH